MSASGSYMNACPFMRTQGKQRTREHEPETRTTHSVSLTATYKDASTRLVPSHPPIPLPSPQETDTIHRETERALGQG